MAYILTIALLGFGLVLVFYLAHKYGIIERTIGATEKSVIAAGKGTSSLLNRLGNLISSDGKTRLERKKEKHSSKRILEILKKDLNLPVLPQHIECFDNSNIQGSNPVAACVVFKNAKPSVKEYRHFNIKTVEGPNDYASMEEVVYRRYKRMIDENKELPQLIVIDGGKGQLSSATKSLNQLGVLKNVSIIGIAKRLEEIYYPNDPVPLYLDKNSVSLKIIQHIRNEAHRFGIKFHRNKRSGSFIQSELNEIPGIGDKTIEQLFKKYKSIKKILQLEEDDLSSEIGQTKARLLRNYFTGK